MSTGIHKKIRSYLSIRNDLYKQYRTIQQSEVSADLRQNLADLFEYDQLCYSYHALKSYYDLSKSRWDLDYRNLLDDLASLNARIEEKIVLVDLFGEFPELQMLRRQLKENAKEGGKVAFLIVSLSTDMDAVKQFMADIEVSDWTPERNVSATPSKETTKVPQQAIQSATQPAQPAARPETQQNRAATQPSHPPSQGAAPTTTPPSTLSNATASNASQQVAESTKRASDSQSPVGKRTSLDESFSRFTTWTREHDLSIFRAAAQNPLVPINAIQLALHRDFGVLISPEACRTLMLHYGMDPRTKDKYQYYIQAFHLVASQFHHNRQYVTVPWAEIRLQFARKTGLTLDDWEVRGRYLLFMLHRAVYGTSGEPPSNYSDLADEWRKISDFRGQGSRLAAGKHVPDSQVPPRLEFSKQQASIAVDSEEEIWTPQMLALLVTAHLKIPPGTPNRILSIKHYIYLESKKDIDVREVEERLKWKDIVNAVERIRMSQAIQNPIIPITQSQSPQPQVFQATQPPVSQTLGSQTKVNQTPSGKPQLASQQWQVTPLSNKVQPSQVTKVSQTTPGQTSQIQSSPASTPRTINQFDALLDTIEKLAKPDWYYKPKFPPGTLTEFWDFDKCKCVYVTVEFFAKIPTDTPDLTLKVARANLKKMTRLRLLRAFKIKVLEALVENKLMHMMEQDVFSPLMVAVITSNLGKS